MDEILCQRCKRVLAISEFCAPPSGFRNICKKCDIANAKRYNREHRQEKVKYDRGCATENPRRKWAHACLARHRRAGYTIELTSKQLYELALKAENCFICGQVLLRGLGNKGSMRRASPSLDRLDNERTTRVDNMSTLYRCNATKQDRTLEECVEYCEAVANRFHSHFE